MASQPFRVVDQPRAPAGLAPKVSRGGRRDTCLTHGIPDAARCEDAPEPSPTATQAATSLGTQEGVTWGGHSGDGVGLHAAEGPTSAEARRQAVRGQGPAQRARLRVCPVCCAQGSGQRKVRLTRPTPTVAPARLGLRLWIYVHRPHGSGSPCARLSLAAPGRGLKVRPYPSERRPRVSRADGGNVGARLPTVLAEILTAGARCATLAWVSGAGYRLVWLWLVLVPELWPSPAA